MVLECKERLNELCGNNKVTVLWVPGDEGIPGNEMADELARQGAEKSFIGPEPKFGISITVRKRIVKEWLNREHLRAWISYEGARHTKVFCGTPSRKVSLALSWLSVTYLYRNILTTTTVARLCGRTNYFYR